MPGLGGCGHCLVGGRSVALVFRGCMAPPGHTPLGVTACRDSVQAVGLFGWKEWALERRKEHLSGGGCVP